MQTPDDRDMRRGISAVLMPGQHLDSTVLDLVAVLEGLVANDFEIIVVARRSRESAEFADDWRVRAPRMPLRMIEGDTLAAGCDAAVYSLIFVSAPDGQFDVRELNHLLDEIDKGADVATGYRPRRTDRILRQLQRWGWKGDLDCAFNLFRRRVWNELARYFARHPKASCAEILLRVRRQGYRVVEVPVRPRRPPLAAPATSATSRAA